jgi:carboxylesterase type B
MVWFNGGGFISGSASWPQYDPTKMAAVANDEGRPTIIMSVNYRIGIFGNIASHDLLEDNKSHGQGGVGNYGLRDQQTALKWVQKYIKDFGGDPTKVTLFGESAGSASVNAHMIGKGSERLFSRAILESGTMALVSAFPVTVQDEYYQDVLKMFNITGSTAKERVEALRKLPLEEIFAKIPPGHPHKPTFDGYFIDFTPTMADIEKNQKLFPTWIDEVMFGCTKDDVYPHLKRLTAGFHLRDRIERKGNGHHHRHRAKNI